MASLHVSFGGYSTAGQKAENQDAFAAWHGQGAGLRNKGVVITIADGVSACSRAKEAANLAATTFITDYIQTAASWTVKKSASQVLESINRWCQGQIDYAHSDRSQTVTTFSGLICKSSTGFLFHIGDSRIYRFANKDLEQLTHDHTMLQGDNAVLIRALGIDVNLDVDFKQFPLNVGEVYLLSTDGVHAVLSRKQLKALIADFAQDNPLTSQETLEALAKKICLAALEQGSDDNVSCVLAHVDTLPASSLEEACAQFSKLAIPPDLSPGMKLEGKRVIDTLFNGTRSTMYKVVDEASNHVYGLKVPSAYFADDPVQLDGFLREEWIGQHIDNPHVMKVWPRPEDAQFMYHICEYIEGQTLRQWMIDNPRPSLDQVRRIITQLIAALRALQRQQMVHRDVKPENVMINAHGEVKLIDFGTVRVASQEEVGEQLASHHPLGSVNYIAPEYLLHNRSDFRSDLFSCAVVCYELLAGALPFKPFPYEQYIPSHYGEWQYKAITKHRLDMPRWVDLTLKKALKANPESRYLAFSEFESALMQPSADIIQIERKQPLIERNPLQLWQWISATLLCIVLIQWWLLSR